MTRLGRLIAAALALQAAAIGGYWLVEQRRGGDGSADAAPGTAPPQPIDLALPALTLRTREGGRVSLRPRERPTLLHVWATWCPPCRAELPALRALPAERALDVVALALDEDWTAVNGSWSEHLAGDVFLADAGDVARRLSITRLPVTFLLLPNGRLTLRFDGARDWGNERFVDSWLAEVAGG